MNTEKVKKLLALGRTPRKVAAETGWNRHEIQAIANQMNSRRFRKNAITASLAILAVIGTIFFAYTRRSEPGDLEVYSNIVKVSNALPTDKSRTSWFINQERDPRTPEDFSAELSLLERLTGEINKALTDNIDIPQVRDQWEMFGDRFIPSLFSSFQGGTTRTISKELKIPHGSKNQEVVFYGHFALDHPRIRHRLLFYDPDWRALIVAALNFNDKVWHDVILIHELWHAKMHREGNPTAIAPMLSDSWVTEELQAHDLEQEILNARTGGEYKRRLQTVTARRAAKNLKDFLLKLQTEDFVLLDSLFKPSIQEEVDIRAAQYALSLSQAWLASQYQGDELNMRRTEVYRYLIDPRQSTGVK